MHFVLRQFTWSSGERHATLFHEIEMVRDLQRQMGVLLDQENRHTLAVQFGDDTEDFLDDDRAQPSDGSSISETRGRDISARATASICCSPPDSVPASCSRHSSRGGKRVYICSMSAATSELLRW